MITLHYVDGNIFTYDVDDWCELRNKHRVVGQVIGSFQHIPSLPLRLMPEEALLLLEKNIAVVQKVSYVEQNKEKQKEFEEKLLLEQQKEYRRLRKIQLESMIDKIVEKRRKLNDNRSKEEILLEELEKSSQVTSENIIWPILLKHDNYTTETVAISSILSQTTLIKSKVYANLWERGYYITNGEKFGGDFLVYFGDPFVHHAIFIVKCIKAEQTFSSTQLVAFGRLGVSVKKRAVLASLKDEQVSYLTINWIDA